MEFRRGGVGRETPPVQRSAGVDQMTVSQEQITAWLNAKEDTHVEFKSAREQMDSQDIVNYCVALSNEGGGHLVLGITPKIRRRICGTNALKGKLDKEQSRLLQQLHLRIDVEEINHPKGRLVVFSIPGRPIGEAIHYKGKYLMRSGEQVVPMTPDKLKRIFAETSPDFSAEICPKATLSDLSAEAIQRFREKWALKSRNPSLNQLTEEQVLRDAELVVNGQLTYAALILFGTRSALGKHLAQAEVCFEYRSNEASIQHQQRVDYREGFFLFEESLIQTINLRNDMQHFQDGLFVWDIPTFTERVVREAVLNALTHRDYRSQASVFVRQYPRRITITSPGGFPAGVTPANVLYMSVPRNRRIADAFQKCGFVERGGQGMDLIFRAAITEGKPLPDFTGSDDYQVALTLRGDIQDEQFLRFLERIGKETLESFSIEDLLLLDKVHREERIPGEMKPRTRALVEQGILESYGRGRGVHFILSRKFYGFLEQKGAYTRKRGLDRSTNKELLFKHIADNQKEGSPLRDLLQVLPALSYAQVRSLLQELKGERRICPVGTKKSTRWFPGKPAGPSTGSAQNDANSKNEHKEAARMTNNKKKRQER